MQTKMQSFNSHHPGPAALQLQSVITAATVDWAALVSGAVDTVSCSISVKPGDWRLSRQLPASPNLGPCRTIALQMVQLLLEMKETQSYWLPYKQQQNWF